MPLDPAVTTAIVGIIGSLIGAGSAVLTAWLTKKKSPVDIAATNVSAAITLTTQMSASLTQCFADRDNFQREWTKLLVLKGKQDVKQMRSRAMLQAILDLWEEGTMNCHVCAEVQDKIKEVVGYLDANSNGNLSDPASDNLSKQSKRSSK